MPSEMVLVDAMQVKPAIFNCFMENIKMMKKNLKDSAVIGVTSTTTKIETKMEEDLKLNPVKDADLPESNKKEETPFKLKCVKIDKYYNETDSVYSRWRAFKKFGLTEVDNVMIAEQRVKKRCAGSYPMKKMLGAKREEEDTGDKNNFSVSEENGIFIARANDPDYFAVFSEPSVNRWSSWSWNPVTGCINGCDYCYAKNIVEKDKQNCPRGFCPTFYPDRLNAPKNTKIPESKKDDVNIKHVIVCDTADLFGDWIPSEIIFQVFEVCRETPDWHYWFLTKNPDRYAKLLKEKDGFDFPTNCTLEVTADTYEQFINTYDALSALDGQFNHDFLLHSFEPLHEELMHSNFTNIGDDLLPFNLMLSRHTIDEQPPLRYIWLESLYMRAPIRV